MVHFGAVQARDLPWIRLVNSWHTGCVNLWLSMGLNTFFDLSQQ